MGACRGNLCQRKNYKIEDGLNNLKEIEEELGRREERFTE